MTFFLVIDLVLRIFPFFSHIFRMFTMLNVVYDHFLTRKPPFFHSVHTFTHIRQHCFSKYWGGPMHGPSPHLKFWGDRPPLGLRPWVEGVSFESWYVNIKLEALLPLSCALVHAHTSCATVFTRNVERTQKHGYAYAYIRSLKYFSINTC